MFKKRGAQNMDIDDNAFDEHGDDEGLECDFSAYKLFHEGTTGAPCLSFDVLPDDLGNDRSCDSPLTCYFVAGTQSDRAQINNIILMKMANLHRNKQVTGEGSDEDSELEDDEDEGTQSMPIVSSAFLKHDGCVNRIRSCTVNDVRLCATWSELGRVHIWNLENLWGTVNRDAQMGYVPTENDENEQLIYTFKGHTSEGFAVDWSIPSPGTLATGDCEKHIYVWKPQPGGTWIVEDKPFLAHTGSVEDIQWSPNEPHVFASCSVDKSIKIWDDRAKQNKACMITVSHAHTSDVNVIHWNRNDPFIVSGGDDGIVKIWDLRQLQSGSAVATLKHHKKPVSTVEWHPSDSSVFASGGEDDQILQWDLSVERDPDEQVEEDEDIPQQLLFEHQGQKNVKEIHWHPQIPGLMISTAETGFHIFKTISC